MIMHLWQNLTDLGQIGPYSHPTNFLTTGLKELNIYAVINNYKDFSKIEKKIGKDVDYAIKTSQLCKI